MVLTNNDADVGDTVHVHIRDGVRLEEEFESRSSIENGTFNEEWAEYL